MTSSAPTASSLLASGLMPLPWWGYVVVALVLTHVTIVSVTLYLHRSEAHRCVDLHPAVSHFFRFWLWITTGMVTKEWVAVHRKHHANVETNEDPHSPQTRGIKKVFWQGAELYRDEAKNLETLEKFGHGTPHDWIERNLYARYSLQGCGLMLIVDAVLFGPLGATIWAVQMMWIPIMAAGIINGVGHYWGYRNFSCKDASRNLVPWGVLIGGEELHNNHHAYVTSAKLSSRWYECDLGWMYIRGLAMFGLATVRRVAPRLKLDCTKLDADLETLQAVITHRYAVVTSYVRFVKQAYRVEVARQRERVRRGEFTRNMPSFRRLRQWFLTDESALAESDRAGLASTLEQSTALKTLYAMGRELTALWERSSDSSDELLARLQAWCRRAEQTNISALQNFSRRLRSYA
jgi:stearoyl-CoA desaturase (delta-9 desaturase)